MQTKYEIDDPLRSVTISDGFWGQRIERNRATTLPHVIQKCEEEGHIRNIQIAAGESNADYSGGNDRDSDLFKVMEGAAYCLAMGPDDELDAYLDTLVASLAAAQDPDGYLQSYYLSQKPGVRYDDMHRSLELYCAGHMIEAAVAHFEATGKRTFLDIATQQADHLQRTFGPGKTVAVPGHPDLELALVKLYRATGEKRYLDLSTFFVDMRGDKARLKREYSGKPVIESERHPGRNRPPNYRQDHLPPVEQREATGHAVCACYLFAGMVDIAMERDSQPHADATTALWNDIVHKKLHVSGGIGTHQYFDEGFGDDYLLPNKTYCETCAGIALLLFSHRMGLLTGQAKYADVVEHILFNQFAASIDLEGRNVFYQNPLVSDGTHKRYPWDYPACCPTNMVRTVPQITRLVYATSGNSLYVDQFMGSTADLSLDSGRVRMKQETAYPWDGEISITVEPEATFDFALHIRIPGWVDGNPVPSDLYTTRNGGAEARVTVNGEPVDATLRADGYCVVRRAWQPGDRVDIVLPMTANRVYAHPKVEANQGRVALMRGPILYCLEETDIGSDPEDISLSRTAELTAEYHPHLLDGVTVLTEEDGPLTAVPYNTWNNREPGNMLVWLKEVDQ